MAKIGDILKQPEPGWKRFDDTNPLISYKGTNWHLLSRGVVPNCYNETQMCQRDDPSKGSVEFSFNGTGIRVITTQQMNRSPDVFVEIDGVPSGSYSSGDFLTIRNQVLFYERVGLSDGVHTIKLTGSYMEMDAFDIFRGDIIPPPIKVGDILKQPEPGWKRYDDNNSFITYEGDWRKNESSSAAYSGKYHLCSGKSKINFSFVGSKLRIIGGTHRSWTGTVYVEIDGEICGSYNMVDSDSWGEYSILLYEKNNLQYITHNVVLYADEISSLDAIDIDDTGRLLPPRPKVSLYKKQSGKILMDDFNSINPEWIISPSDSFSIAARKGFMRLNHSADRDVMLLIDKPQGDIAIQVIADYTPDVEGDKGGLIIYQNTDNKIEFLESHSMNFSKEHQEWLATSTGEQWDFYSKVDATFDYADSDKLDATKIGVVLKKGGADSYKPLDIDRILITSGHKLKLRQLFPDNKVILKDENGTTLSINQVGRLNTGIDINLPSLEFQGSIEVYDEQNRLIAEKKTLFYGGDIYNMGSPIKIIMESKELNDTGPTDLGYMIEGKRVIKMIVQNENSVAVQNLKISIEQYMEKVGYTWADISLDNLAWVKQISINTLGANSFREFWVLVTKDLNYIGFEPILFNIKLQHD
ncbi:cell adhesion protein [Bacillus cereus group sp. Bc253]|uniref:cell adhesion protein n=1 Tax=Bacillus cereus group sp. Bc253 TaxID=3018103 RepID=UPI0022E286AC|nr:cell adhesion protein [Bacillus cereus group sp. Bc253]MDA2157918.1 cell adhesion protein [Bacillus cereus group sp. Bc253]